MASRETQARIVETAVALFNRHGTRAVSTNRIADECELSRGNLHYHFRTKEEIIQTVFSRIDRQMEESWYEDHLDPSMKRMVLMFRRQMQLIWDYRFFYRELTMLLQNDARLKVLFMDNRRKRVREVELFFREMVRCGLLDIDENADVLESLLLISWLISDQWLPYLDMSDTELSEANIRRGFDLIVRVFLPYFTAAALREYRVIIEAEACG